MRYRVHVTRRVNLSLVAAIVAVTTFTALPAWPAAAAADVLMLGSTLQGGTASPEYQAAHALGFTVHQVAHQLSRPRHLPGRPDRVRGA